MKIPPISSFKKIKPDVLGERGDYKPEEIVGYDMVTARGGKVLTVDLTAGYSSTRVIGKLTDNP